MPAIMATQEFPYETRLNVYYKPLEVVDEKALADDCEYKWYNQTLCQVNNAVVRLGVVEGEYHWHKHDDDDEFFYVVEGELLIDLEDRTVALPPRKGFVVSQRRVAPHAGHEAHGDSDGGERGHYPDWKRADRKLTGWPSGSDIILN
jgi:hypothetical protein